MPDSAKPMIFAGTRRRRHESIHDRAARAAGGFVAAGLEPGDTIALLLRNDFAFFEASLAAKRAGIFPVPLNWNASAEDIAYILRDCRAEALVAHADLLTADITNAVLAALPAPAPLLVVATPDEIRTAFDPGDDQPMPDRVQDWDAWINRQTPLARPIDGASAPVIFTSGSTGRPKGVRRKPQSTGSAKAHAVYGFDRDPPIVALINGSMYHSVANAYGRLALQVGADIVLQPRFEPEDMLALVARHRVTHLHIVTAMMVRLLRLPAGVRARYDVSSLRYIVHGAAPCPRAVKLAMIDWFGPILHEYYGSTETGLLTVHGSDEARAKPNTVGRALPGITLAILDEDGQALPPGEIGEIFAGSATLQDFTYIGDADKRAAAGRGDLVTAGDIGWLDRDDYLYLAGRKSEIFRCEGVAIFPLRIEAALLDHRDVRDCAVFGLPDAVLGNIVCACVELIANALDLDHLRTRAAEVACVPVAAIRVEIFDKLPREDSGKIFKRKLREQVMHRPPHASAP